jgi:hypothetical protein
MMKKLSSDLMRFLCKTSHKGSCAWPCLTWYTECSNTIQDLLAKKVLDRELPIVQAIVDTRRKSKSERNVIFELSLFKTTFNGYPLIQWTTELEMSTEMRQFLIEAGFTPGVTSKISEGPASIISLVIDDRKWAFEDVKFLIRKGHDLNKYDQNSLSFNRHRRSPFFVAVESHRYDIAKFLLRAFSISLLPICIHHDSSKSDIAFENYIIIN